MAGPDVYRRYFSRKPHKSPVFCAITVWLIVITAWPFVLAWKVSDQPKFGGWDGGLTWMCMALVAPIGLWIAVRRAHLKLYQIILESRGPDNQGDKRFDAALTQAYYLAFSGLSAALFAVQAAFFGFAKLLGR